VGRIFGEWRRAGYIRTGRSSTVILRPEALEQIIRWLARFQGPRASNYRCRTMSCMTSDTLSNVYATKAIENLESAGSELVNRRYNASANRAYYACFQAAIVALLEAGVSPRSGRGWGHDFVQAQFAGSLIGRRKRYSATLRTTLPRLAELREKSDYGHTVVSQAQAARAFAQAEAFVQAVLGGSGR
jgi:uncharacterized protein (UPF0332 family)